MELNCCEFMASWRGRRLRLDAEGEGCTAKAAQQTENKHAIVIVNQINVTEGCLYGGAESSSRKPPALGEYVPTWNGGGG